MKYVSTRGQAAELTFDDVLLSGLARDGGLFVPTAWPQLSADDLRAMKDLSYAETAFRVIRPFVGANIGDDDLAAIVGKAYASFDHPDVVPLREIKDGVWLMEMFHGPTLAFKDVAMQFLGGIFDHVLSQRGERGPRVLALPFDDPGQAIDPYPPESLPIGLVVVEQ